MVRYTLVPSFVELESNVEYIPTFQLGEHLFSKIDPCENKGSLVSVKFKVTDEVIDAPCPLTHLVGPYYSLDNEDAIYGVQPLFRFRHLDRVKLQLLIRNLNIDTEFVVNTLYYKLLRFPIYEWFTPGHHLMNIIHAKLLLNGFSFLHCASIFDNNLGGIMLFGSPNTGKTLTSFLCAMKYGYKIISEDVTLADGKGFIYSCPYTSTYHRNKFILNEITRGALSRKDMLKLRFSNLFDRVAILSAFSPRSWQRSSILNTLSVLPFISKAKAKFLIFLVRTKSNSEKVDILEKNDAIKYVSLLNRFEFDYSRDPLLLVSSFYNQNFNPDELFKNEQKIIRSLIEKCEGLFVIKADSPLKYVTQLNKIFRTYV